MNTLYFWKRNTRQDNARTKHYLNLPVAACLAIVATFMPLAHSAIVYNAYFLDNFGYSDSDATARAINNAGQVAGFESFPVGGNRATLYDANRPQDHGFPVALDKTEALAISEAPGGGVGGLLVGASNGHAAVFGFGGQDLSLSAIFQPKDIEGKDKGPIIKVNGVMANGVNRAGQIVGYAIVPIEIYVGLDLVNSFEQRAVLFDAINRDTGKVIGTSRSIAQGINDNGIIVGENKGVAALFSARDGEITILNPTNTSSIANAINNRNEIVGMQDGIATLFNVSGFLGTGLGATNKEPDISSEAFAINNAEKRQIVGKIKLFPGSQEHAALFSLNPEERFLDLNDLIPDEFKKFTIENPGGSPRNLEWLLTSAYGINDSGWIVGVAEVQGQSMGPRRAFLLKPVNAVPEPGTLYLFVMGAFALLSNVARKRVGKDY